MSTGSGDPALDPQVWRRSRDVVSRTIAGEFLLVPIRGKLVDLQKIYAMNAVGEFIWQSLDERRDITEISCALSERFEVTTEQAEADIREFLAVLRDAGLVSG